ncbi:hypothetical protein MnTg02_00292 [bacterium MnTg02]|nr:hypothetical protein MnTg02_00292 [bacterium MnTg02]
MLFRTPPVARLNAAIRQRKGVVVPCLDGGQAIPLALGDQNLLRRIAAHSPQGQMRVLRLRLPPGIIFIGQVVGFAPTISIRENNRLTRAGAGRSYAGLYCGFQDAPAFQIFLMFRQKVVLNFFNTNRFFDRSRCRTIRNDMEPVVAAAMALELNV